jgi:hypothetical protein
MERQERQQASGLHLVLLWLLAEFPLRCVLQA